MAGGGQEDADAFGVARWRIVTLFLLILFVDAMVEIVDGVVLHYLRRNPESAHAWAQLKFEVMALGVVSLLLVVFEEHLLKICINSPNKDDSSSEDDALYGYAPEATEELLEADAHRRLLAGGVFAMRKWHKFEANVQGRGLLPLPVGGLQREGEPMLVYGLRQCVRQFTHPVNEAQFGAIRALFIHLTKSEESFDFAGFINSIMIAEFATVVKFDVFMWGLVVIWVVFPDGSYGGFWLTGGFILLSIIAGAKLHSVAMHLSRHAYSRFYKPVSHKPSKQEFQGISKNKLDDIESSRKSPAGPVGEAVEREEDEALKVDDEGDGASAPEGIKRAPLRRLVRGHSQRIKGAAEDADLVKLFWFRQPRHMLRIFRYAFFTSALGCASIIFRFWHHEDDFLGGALSDYGKAVKAVGWVFFGLVLLLLVHISMYLLPVYALTGASVMLSNVEGVLKFAKEANIRPDLVDFLEHTAVRKGDDDSDDEEVLEVPVVAPCTDKNACTATQGNNGSQTEVAGPEVKHSEGAAQLTERTGSLFAKEESAREGTVTAVSSAALSKITSASTTEVAAAAVAAADSEKPSSDAEGDVQAGLGARAAAEMPTSGGEGGGEVDWFDQIEREQGDLLAPAAAALSAQSQEQSDKQDAGTAAITLQSSAATPVECTAAVPVQHDDGAVDANVTQPDLFYTQEDTPVAVLAAAEMPLSGVGGDAAVDWLDKLEREQGEVGSAGSQSMAPMHKRGSRNILAQFKHAAGSRIPRVGSEGKQLDAGGTNTRGKNFAKVMLGRRPTSDLDSMLPGAGGSVGADGNVRSRRGSTHSAGKDKQIAHGSGGAHEHHHEPRPPTLSETVSKLLESMASQRRVELSRRMYHYGT